MSNPPPHLLEDHDLSAYPHLLSPRVWGRAFGTKYHVVQVGPNRHQLVEEARLSPLFHIHGVENVRVRPSAFPGSVRELLRNVSAEDVRWMAQTSLCTMICVDVGAGQQPMVIWWTTLRLIVGKPQAVRIMRTWRQLTQLRSPESQDDDATSHAAGRCASSNHHTLLTAGGDLQPNSRASTSETSLAPQPVTQDPPNLATLPHEILVLILQHLAPEDGDECDLLPPSWPSYSGLALACQRLYRFAWPRLLGQVTVYICHHVPSIFRRFQEVADQPEMASQIVRLSLRHCGMTSDYRETEKNAELFATQLLPRLTNLQDLRIIMPNDMMVGWSWSLQSLTPVLTNLPALVALECQDFFWWEPPQSLLNRLQKLKVTILSAVFTIAIPFMPNLQTLELVFLLPDIGEGCINGDHVPQLRVLSIETETTRVDYPGELNLISGVARSLEVLSLRRTVCSESVLRAAPGLRELRLDRCYQREIADPIDFPELTYLEVAFLDAHRFDFIRAPPGATLRKWCVTETPHVKDFSWPPCMKMIRKRRG